MDLQEQINILKAEIDSMKASYSFPKPVADAIREVLGAGVVVSGTTTAGATTVISAFPFNLPANPSGALTVVYNGVTYNLLYK